MRTLIFFLLFTGSLAAQSPLEVAQEQLDAYNAQDLERFVSVFASDAKIYSNLGDTLPSMEGQEAIRARYGQLFERFPENRSILMGRMVQGNFVFDHEYITGRENPARIMAIYEIVDGKIVRCWFAR